MLSKNDVLEYQQYFSIATLLRRMPRLTGRAGLYL